MAIASSSREKRDYCKFLVLCRLHAYTALGSVNIWPSKECVSKFMPAAVKVIADCTEMLVQKPYSLVANTVLHIVQKHNLAKWQQNHKRSENTEVGKKHGLTNISFHSRGENVTYQLHPTAVITL